MEQNKQQQVLNQINQIAKQLEEQEAQNAQKLQQGQQFGAQQQMANLEQNAAQQLSKVQNLVQQSQTEQSYTASTGASQSVFQPGFAGTDAEEVKQQNQQSQNGGSPLQ